MQIMGGHNSIHPYAPALKGGQGRQRPTREAGRSPGRSRRGGECSKQRGQQRAGVLQPQRAGGAFWNEQDSRLGEGAWGGGAGTARVSSLHKTGTQRKLIRKVTGTFLCTQGKTAGGKVPKRSRHISWVASGQHPRLGRPGKQGGLSGSLDHAAPTRMPFPVRDGLG